MPAFRETDLPFEDLRIDTMSTKIEEMAMSIASSENDLKALWWNGDSVGNLDRFFLQIPFVFWWKLNEFWMSKRFVNLWSFFLKEAQKLRDEEASVFSKEEQEPREPSVGGCEFLGLVGLGIVSFWLCFWIGTPWYQGLVSTVDALDRALAIIGHEQSSGLRTEVAVQTFCLFIIAHSLSNQSVRDCELKHCQVSLVWGKVYKSKSLLQMEDSALPLVEVLVERCTNVMLVEYPFGHQQVEALSAVVEAW